MSSTYRPGIETVRGDVPWSVAEQALLEDCRLGDGVIAGGDRPEDQSDPDRRVRAGLIRYLALGGCEDGERPHPKGVQLLGAWIDGAVDFQGCVTGLDISLHKCLFRDTVSFVDAELGGLYLTGSRLEQGLNLHRISVETDVHLRDGFHATGLVDLASARISGQLACSKGRFDGNGGPALTCNAAEIGADVFLSEGFHATGLVDLPGTRISGQLACVGGRFDGGGGPALICDAAEIGADVFLRDGFHATGLVDLVRARIGGNLQITEARFETGTDPETGSTSGGVTLEAARIGEGLFWRGIAGEVALLDLTETKAGVLRDEAVAWEKVRFLILSGFAYERLESAMSVHQRLDWLSQGMQRRIPPAFSGEMVIDGRKVDLPPAWAHGGNKPDFDPQPYTHLAKVLDAQGNRSGAARVRYRRGVSQRLAAWYRAQAGLDGSVGAGWAAFRADLRRGWDFIFRWLFGYGHQPARALVSVFLIWAVTALFYGHVYDLGQMAPNSDVILTSAHWLAAVGAYDACVAAGKALCMMPQQLWEQTPPSVDYETFSRGLYALDLFVPLDALGQETTWAPSKLRGGWGHAGYSLRWLIQLAGWLITAVGAGVVTGLVGQKD